MIATNVISWTCLKLNHAEICIYIWCMVCISGLWCIWSNTADRAFITDCCGL